MKRRDALCIGLTVAGYAAFPALGQTSSRVAIVIAVDKAGTLTPLNAAVSGAKQVAEWLNQEGFEVFQFLDDEKPVRVGAIKETIQTLTQRGNIEQLLIYFAGHGFVNNYSEFWMLSNATTDVNEAISSRECHDLSRTFGFGNVVFISDACRSVANTLNTTRIVGSVVFPLGSSRNRPTRVDKFMATGVGEQAWEVHSDPTKWEGIFTTCLLEAFKCPAQAMVVDANGKRVIPNRRLATYLETEVPKRAQAISLQIVQTPDTEICSDEPTFIGGVASGDKDCKPSATSPAPSVQEVANQMIKLSGAGRPISQLSTAQMQVASASGLDAAHKTIVVARGVPTQPDLQCGFVVFGQGVKGATASDGYKASVRPEPGATIVEVYLQGQRGCSVALRFDDGSGTLLAALAGFVANVTVDRGRVVNVSYVPAVRSAAYADYKARQSQLDSMHASVAAAARLGVFRLDGPDSQRTEASRRLAEQIRLLKGIDPTLGVYAAYAYSDAGLVEQIRSVENFMRGDLGLDIFDVAMLAGKLNGQAIRLDKAVVPFLPMLSQGWSGLRIRRVTLGEEVSAIRASLRPSLWTTVEDSGMNRIESILSGQRRIT